MENKNKIVFYRNDSTGELTTDHKRAVLEFLKTSNVTLLNASMRPIGGWVK